VNDILAHFWGNCGWLWGLETCRYFSRWS